MPTTQTPTNPVLTVAAPTVAAPTDPSPSGRIPLYSTYERMWHWLQATAILLLIATGLVIHNPDAFVLVSFSAAVSLHNALGFLLIANALLGVFYYVTTGSIRQYLPEPREFVALSIQQATFYLRGMFRGEPHPLAKTRDRRLNPLQQTTYLVILNVLLPLQLVTGLLMWSGQRWPDAVSALGGLAGLALWHTMGAWLFGSFVIAHVYLTTTGSTPLAHLKAMLWGYEEITAEHAPVQAEASSEFLVSEDRS